MYVQLPCVFVFLLFFLEKVAETGMYVVLVANCDPRTGSILISGHSEWKNPYGEDVAESGARARACFLACLLSFFVRGFLALLL